MPKIFVVISWIYFPFEGNIFNFPLEDSLRIFQKYMCCVIRGPYYAHYYGHPAHFMLTLSESNK